MNLDKKQKILIPVTAIVLGILGWQLYGLFSENSGPAPMAQRAPIQPVANNMPRVNQPMPGSNATARQTAPVSAPAVSEQDKQRLKEVSQSDAEYLKLIQEYQLLQVQRRIAEDTRAIAVAKLETVKALAETNKFGGPTNMGSNTLPMGNIDADYKLVFTGQEAGQWTATLKMNDQLMDVVTGTNLPDGYKVTTVDSDSVTLQKADKQKVISFLGVHESELKQTDNNSSKQAKADALLQIIAPDKANKTQPASTPEHVPDLKAVSPNTQTGHGDISASKPVVLDKKDDKSTLTAAFLNKEQQASEVKLATNKQEAKPVAQVAAASNEKKPVATDPTNVKASEKNKPLQDDTANHIKPAAKPIKISSGISASIKPAVTQNKEQITLAKPVTKAVVDRKESATAILPSNYTIQLMSDRDEAAVKNFASQNNLTDKAHYFQAYVKGQKRYVLTYGNYANLQTAQDGLKALPKAAKRWQPFVRKFSGLVHTAYTKEKPVHHATSRPQSVSIKHSQASVDAEKMPTEITY